MTQTATPIHFNIQAGDQLTWNVTPLLHEVRHALNKLLDCGETTIIDLRSIPLAPGEEEKILAILGRGEVTAQLNVLGSSEVFESNYPGVWVVTHHNDDNEIIARFVEVTTLPEILRSQSDDIRLAVSRLDSRLQDEEEGSEYMVGNES